MVEQPSKTPLEMRTKQMSILGFIVDCTAPSTYRIRSLAQPGSESPELNFRRERCPIQNVHFLFWSIIPMYRFLISGHSLLHASYFGGHGAQAV